MARSNKIPVKKQGSDIPIVIYIKTSSGAVDIDGLAELYVYLMMEGKSGAVAKFSKAGTGDCTALVRVDSTHYRADYLSEDTKDADPGDYYLEMNVVETNASYTDSEKNSIGSKTLFTLEASTIKDQSS